MTASTLAYRRGSHIVRPESNTNGELTPMAILSASSSPTGRSSRASRPGAFMSIRDCPREGGGYRGHSYPNKFRVWIFGRVRHVTVTVRREVKRRAAVEPVIGHIKAEHQHGSQSSEGARRRPHQRRARRAWLQLLFAAALTGGAFARLNCDAPRRTPRAAANYLHQPQPVSFTGDQKLLKT